MHTLGIAAPKVTRLTPALGAEISGLSLTQTPANPLREIITRLLHQHQVLFFRNQHLNPQQHYDFAKLFGDLHIHPIYPNVPDRPEIMLLDTHNTTALLDNSDWHSDVSCIERPPMGAILTAQHLPVTGGDTIWSSATAVYESLSAPLRALLVGLTAEHDLIHAFTEAKYAQTAEGRARWQAAREKNPPVNHPVIRTHPETKQKAVFVNETFTRKINELHKDESAALLQCLYQRIADPQFSVRWRWQEGDVAFWDNRITQHRAIDDYHPARRIMHRATILGEKPV